MSQYILFYCNNYQFICIFSRSMRSLGAFGLRGASCYDGENYCVTESIRIIEEVASANLNISNVIVNSSWYGAEIIKKFGSDDLKQKYLPKIYSGTSISALCMADTESGSDPESTKMTAIQKKDGMYCPTDYYILNVLSRVYFN